MTTSRLIKKNLKRSTEQEERQRLAVQDWWTMYGHNYPTLSKASPDPARSILALMQDQEYSAKEAAQAAEKFAAEWEASKPPTHKTQTMKDAEALDQEYQDIMKEEE